MIIELEHKLIDKYPLISKRNIILGTFTPKMVFNQKSFFHSEKKNYFWQLLPEALEENSLLQANTDTKLAFLQKHNIALADVLYSARIEEEDYCSYSDEKLLEDACYTPKILEVLAQGEVENVYFLRKSFRNIKWIHNEVRKVEEFCKKNSITFMYLPNPKSYVNIAKQQEWNKAFKQAI